MILLLSDVKRLLNFCTKMHKSVLVTSQVHYFSAPPFPLRHKATFKNSNLEARIFLFSYTKLTAITGFHAGPAKCEPACRAKTRQALCKANVASRRLVLVSGRLVSLALFIVGATRHLLKTRLCPLCPHSTAQRELVNGFFFEVFARTPVRRGERRWHCCSLL